MGDPTQLLYLEPDDEITSVVRRLREADAGRVVLVAPGRSRVTTSAVALRLLAGVAADDGRDIALVSDAAGRALAAEAGIDAFPSVSEANAENPMPPEPPLARRAAIRVVRGEEARVATLAPRDLAGSGDETMAIPVARPVPPPRADPPARPARARRRALSRAAVGALVVLLLVAVAGAAAVAPAATVVIRPVSVPIEPVRYTLTLPAAGVDEDELTAQTQGTATGVFVDPSPATGTVDFSNWNTVDVLVPAGTEVAAGDVLFVTLADVTVPIGFFTPFAPGEASADVQAVEPGPAGNVPSDAIDRVVTDGVRASLRGLPDNPNRLVRNRDATAGGSENRQPQVTRRDVNAAADAIRADLADQLEGALTDAPGMLYGEVEADEPAIDIPDDLVRRRGEETFTLGGSLAYRRARVAADDVEGAARDRLLDDGDVTPPGRSIVEDSIEVEVRRVTRRGGNVEVRVTVTSLAEPIVDAEAVRGAVAGLTEPDAERALADLGNVEIDLWPGWVDRVPQLEWRIDLQVDPAVAASAQP